MIKVLLQGLCVLALCAVIPAGFCRAEELRVRLINTKNGEGMKGYQFWLLLGRRDLGPSRPALDATTGSDGVAIFQLPSPAPQEVTVGSSDGRIYHCSDFWKNNYPTQQVLLEGVTLPLRCEVSEKVKAKVQAKPGEIVLFARPLRWYERGQW
jgi:hypothetical protein